MSLVGTRPPTVDEWEQYEPHHRARMAFRPGLTGLWQVSGRSNITDFEEVVKLDTKYGYSFLMENCKPMKRRMFKLIESVCAKRNCTTISCSMGEHQETLKLTKHAAYESGKS